jgi:hypothetical protein
MLAGEAARTISGRRANDQARDELKRALCITAERLAIAGVDLEAMLTAVRVGDHRGRWTLECAPSHSPRRAPTGPGTPERVSSLAGAGSEKERER